MFDQHAQEVINAIADLPDLDPDTCRRLLSRAYLLVVEGRLNGTGRSDDLDSTVDALRRLADALESVAVFDAAHGIPRTELTRTASAFVAGEALFLLSNLYPQSEVETQFDDPLQDQSCYAAIEAGLLYMIGGYDINAVTAVANVPQPPATPLETLEDRRNQSAKRLLRRLVNICRGTVNYTEDALPYAGDIQPTLAQDLLDDTRARIYDLLTDAVDHFANWLTGHGSLDTSSNIIQRVIDATRADIGLSLFGLDAASPEGGIPHGASQFADIFHLAHLMAAAFRAMGARSVVHSVPPPDKGDAALIDGFQKYIRARAAGASNKPGRPLLWPTTIEYVRECLPGPHKDAVVSMPTGSGKSFLAELAVVHALPRGWVLYLAPTNALAQQIRRDLANALAIFGDDLRVSAFIGGAEYAALHEAEITGTALVAVMTPEKCALALRLYPQAFAHCALCVFDECHLLNDGNRGAIADVLLAQLFHVAPDMRTLLMSAMVSNPDDLASWLASVRGQKALSSRIKWRPSRAARGFIFVDKLAATRAKVSGRTTLDSGLAKKHTVQVPLAWLVGLSGPWTHDGPDDYRVAALPLSAEYVARQKKDGSREEGFTSWKNSTGQSVAELFASHKMPTINFVMTSRHHAFSNANDVNSAIPDAVGIKGLPSIVVAKLALADAELGVETAMRDLLARGIAVHTAAMLPVEQSASEHMFAEGHAKLMFATGTLAQGLNLPAAVVVVSGSKLPQHGASELDAGAGLTRAKELILNGFGRAGRPGFANQGVVILVSDKELHAPVASNTKTGPLVLAQYPVFGEPDASVSVRSPIEDLIDRLLAGDQASDDPSALQLVLTSLLAAFDGPDENAGAVLRRTFAGYQRRAELTPERAAIVNDRIHLLKDRFLELEGVPSWMAKVAMKAGVDFQVAHRIWQAYQDRGTVTLEEMHRLDVRGWFELLISVLSRLPPMRIAPYLADNKTPTPRTKLFELATSTMPSLEDTDTIPWSRPSGWEDTWNELGAIVWSFMSGESYAKLNSLIFGTPVADVGGGRTYAAEGIPAVFKFISEVIDRTLSMDAGCFLALHECWLAEEHPEATVPEALQGLPLCIRNGCSSLDVLAWYRSGFRQRVSAHALAEAFPIPPFIDNDADRATFVRKARRAWLNDRPVDGEPLGLLDYARVVRLDDSSERN